MNTFTRKLRKGVGYVGKVFQYGTAVGPDGVTSHNFEGREKRIRDLNKHPAMRRATKKAARRSDDKFYA